MNSLRALLLLCAACASLAAAGRPRLAVLTDIGGDPDDQQSLVRLMVYANEFEIEALIASAAGTPGELKQAVTRPELIREIIGAYGEVLPRLKLHAGGWPKVEQLLAVVKSGNPQRGRPHIGAGHDTEGSRFLIERIDAATPERPLNIAIWGGQTDLAQALWRVKHERGADGLAGFVKNVRVYDISDQDGIADWMRDAFPGMNYLLAKAPAGRDKREGTYRGMYLTGDESLTSREWIEENIRGTGPLGALYPTRTFTAPNKHACLKEGDTPSWFFFLPSGGNDPKDPAKPGWGGQYQREPDGWWRDLPAREGFDPRSSVSRWRPDFQKDFARRMAWCHADIGSKVEARPAPFTLSGRDGRMALVAPDGKPFLPLGLNHLGVALKAAVNGSKLSATQRAARLAQMERDLRDWHFNTVGYGAAPEMWAKFPFIAEVSLTHCGHYLTREQFAYDDVFDPAFHANVRQRIADLCAKTRSNPNCLGYWWTDTPRWDLDIAQRLHGKTWVSSIRALPDDAPGKRRYAAFLRGPEPRDDRAFLGLIARELYLVTSAAFKEHDPQRLIFGERYKLGDHPPEVLAEAVKFVDVISIQPGPEVGPLAGPGREESEFDAARFDALHALTGKPILICDHQVSFHDPAQPVTLWHQFPTEAEAADAYEAFVTAAFARPYIIGYFRCQYWNQWRPAPRSLLKQGLRQSDGQPYAEMIRRVANINGRVMKQFISSAVPENRPKP